jgi:hypothetical protein
MIVEECRLLISSLCRMLPLSQFHILSSSLCSQALPYLSMTDQVSDAYKTEGSINSTVLWGVDTLYLDRLVSTLRVSVLPSSLGKCSTLKMEAAGTIETLVPIYKTTGRTNTIRWYYCSFRLISSQLAVSFSNETQVTTETLHLPWAWLVMRNTSSTDVTACHFGSILTSSMFCYAVVTTADGSRSITFDRRHKAHSCPQIPALSELSGPEASSCGTSSNLPSAPWSN